MKAKKEWKIENKQGNNVQSSSDNRKNDWKWIDEQAKWEYDATETKAFMFITNVLLSYFFFAQFSFFVFFWHFEWINGPTHLIHGAQSTAIKLYERSNASNISRLNGSLTARTYVCIEHRRYNLSCDSLNSNEPENTFTCTFLGSTFIDAEVWRNPVLTKFRIEIFTQKPIRAKHRGRRLSSRAKPGQHWS